YSCDAATRSDLGPNPQRPSFSGIGRGKENVVGKTKDRYPLDGWEHGEETRHWTCQASNRMSSEGKQDRQLQIAHVLFIDIVGYSKLPINRQSELLQQLNQIVRATEQFRRAEAADRLVRLPAGDGMALAFFTSPDAPVKCAIEISKTVGQAVPRAGGKRWQAGALALHLRMGINSGPV